MNPTDQDELLADAASNLASAATALRTASRALQVLAARRIADRPEPPRRSRSANDHLELARAEARVAARTAYFSDDYRPNSSPDTIERVADAAIDAARERIEAATLHTAAYEIREAARADGNTDREEQAFKNGMIAAAEIIEAHL